MADDKKTFRLRPDTPHAAYISVGECKGCGGGVIFFLDEDDTVIAQAHFPVEEDWLEDEFIPALRAAKHGQLH